MKKQLEFDTEELFVEDLYPMRLAQKLAREKRRSKSRHGLNPDKGRYRRDYDEHDVSMNRSRAG
jgi:hypothetical protein